MRTVAAVVCGLVALALSVLVLGAFLAGHVFPGEFLALFRVQYAIGLLVVAAALAALRAPELAALTLAVLVLDVAAFAPAYLAPSSPDPETVRLRMVVANVWHPGNAYARLSAVIRDANPDVVGLVELTPGWDKGLAPALSSYRYRIVKTGTGAFGVGIYSRIPLTGAAIIHVGGPFPATATAKLAIGGKVVRLYLVHPPPPVGVHSAERNRAVLRGVGDLAGLSDGAAIVCGDMNATPWSAPFRDLLSRGGLRRADPIRLLQWTWPVDRIPLRIPIDNCAVGSALEARVTIGPDFGSDHRPQIVEIGVARG